MLTDGGQKDDSEPVFLQCQTRSYSDGLSTASKFVAATPDFRKLTTTSTSELNSELTDLADETAIGDCDAASYDDDFTGPIEGDIYPDFVNSYKDEEESEDDFLSTSSSSSLSLASLLDDSERRPDAPRCTILITAPEDDTNPRTLRHRRNYANLREKFRLDGEAVAIEVEVHGSVKKARKVDRRKDRKERKKPVQPGLLHPKYKRKSFPVLPANEVPDRTLAQRMMERIGISSSRFCSSSEIL